MTIAMSTQKDKSNCKCVLYLHGQDIGLQLHHKRAIGDLWVENSYSRKFGLVLVSSGGVHSKERVHLVWRAFLRKEAKYFLLMPNTKLPDKFKKNEPCV